MKNTILSEDNQLLSDLGKSLLTGSLSDDRVLAETDREPPIKILPNAAVLKIGGQSFMDRGRSAVFPLIEEIVENLGRHEMIIGTGGGTRARHAYSVGLDLGLPNGVLSVLGTFVSMQNARLINYLLANYGILYILAQKSIGGADSATPYRHGSLPRQRGIWHESDDFH